MNTQANLPSKASRISQPAPRASGAFFSLISTIATVLLAAAPSHATGGITPSVSGKYPVACSNVEQDFTRLKAGSAASDYWEGNPLADGSHYVTELLVSPADALTFKVTVPKQSDIDVFEKQGGKQIQYAAMACYPTTAGNTRADYALPSGIKVPKMQRGAEAPLIGTNPDVSDGKWPLLVMSHGLAGSPLGDDYVQVAARLAAEGYVVFAPFHADARYSRIKLDNISDYLYVFSKYAEIAEMQAIRPVGLKQGLDYILSKPEYANRVDSDRIVGFGASLGGMAMMLAQGAKLTTSFAGAERVIVRDNRYKAVVGYVPFSGYSFQPAFGDSNGGVRSVRVPYLGIGGTADIVAPLSRTSQMISALGGSKYLVAIEGMPHGFRVQDAPEVFGWTFAFLSAHLSRDQADRVAFNAIASVPGGSDDRVPIRKTLAWGSRDELEVVEYVSVDSKKYFMTGRVDEIAALDAAPLSWQRTGQRFATHRTDSPVGADMCRFWANDGASLNTHFYSTLAADCTLLKAQPWARDEGTVMRAQGFLPQIAVFPPPPVQCPDDTVKVIRLFNKTTVNHRYVTEVVLARTTLTPNWQADGSVFCAAKYED
jgi:predicted dienelactone hydrolase